MAENSLCPVFLILFSFFFLIFFLSFSFCSSFPSIFITKALSEQNTEGDELGIEDALSGNVTLIEWPEIAASLLPQDTIYIQIDIIDDQKRLVSFK